ncbi:hypothetical protein [Roseinatronobacter monicus]|uniref:Uncharacterized protein n=1 Tax=Roseinatronobacter monicus TaxID=393481 RepID=A0A543K4Q4_9RHOB|nr:hypothetical protein [Roseinatronobacter monicus]TQM90061.1 hypothetical protein BD293_3978 [Roseinatronobacter monicus]
MADYFTRFSCLLDVGTPQNAARAYEAFLALRNDAYAKAETLCCGFDLTIESDPSGSQLWIRSEDHGDPEAVTRFVLSLAEDLDLTGLWGFTYAVTCSRLRLDAFGGGAHAIDLGARKLIGWISTQDWLAAALNGEDPHA